MLRASDLQTNYVIISLLKEGYKPVSINASWDLFAGILLVIGVVYGFALQRERIFTSLMSIYVGIVIAGIWSQSLFNFFEGKKMLFNSVWVNANTTPSTVGIVIFMIVVVIISAKAPIGFMRSWSAVTPIETVAYSLLNMILFLLTIYRMLPADLQAKIITQSKFIGPVNNLYNILLIVPLVLLVIVTSRRNNAVAQE